MVRKKKQERGIVPALIKKSKSELKYYDRIIEIIKEHENIELRLT